MKFRRLLASIVAALAISTVSACNQKNGGEKFVDYASQAKLTSYFSSYENKNFLDGGIGAVTLYNPVDGDTAHFYQVENNARLVKVRFYGIDTPESTGQIEPWGKKASKFTTDALKNAGSILLTNGDLTETAATYDSTGTRFKALVWIADEQNAPLDAFKCLNLMIVQEGYSNGKGVADCPLASYFNSADLQAQDLKKGQWSGEDPDFYKGDALNTSIKELVDEFVENKGSCPKFEGKKVKITGIVAKVVDDDAYVVQDFENEETGELERYGIFIFAGYKFYECLHGVGNDLTIVGTFTVRYGNPQITSVSYNPYLPSKDDMVINRKGVEVPYPEMTFNQVDGKREYINLVGQFKHLHATGKGYDAIDKTTQVKSGAMNIELEDDHGNKMTLRVPKNVFLMKKGGTSLDRVTTYTYLSEKDEAGNYKYYIDLTAAIAIYDPAAGSDEEGGSSTKAYYQLTLCNKNDVVYY